MTDNFSFNLAMMFVFYLINKMYTDYQENQKWNRFINITNSMINYFNTISNITTNINFSNFATDVKELGRTLLEKYSATHPDRAPNHSSQNFED